MDWMEKVPGLARLTRTHAWRSYLTLERAHWARLAAAITFLSFLALFPLLTVAAAVAAALIGADRAGRLEARISEQVPGISDQLDFGSLVANAGTVGLVAGAFLLVTGIGWIGSMRDCLRAVWGLDDEDRGNFLLRKAKDTGVLLGLGATALVSLAASALGTSAVGWGAERLGVERGGAGGVLLAVAAIAIAVVADFLMLLYLLTLLPGVRPGRRPLLVAALLGAIGFELLKLLLSGYMQQVAAKSLYGAFGVPVALLLWINFTAKLLLYCAAWTATPGNGSDPVPDSGSVVGDGGAAPGPDGLSSGGRASGG
ncbi:YihY/virulence factor BrkB family protein [Streptomyces clavuligerus]|uniref:YihY/virulence factor BrkB family protein n=1 Tax=Streptomyces clavuligerus TaxID=1901 RepID=UPI0018D01FE8|nr:YihY/virulence factor BrkB family protein [Streptomyces clavuligerus]